MKILFVDLEREWRGGQSQALLTIVGLRKNGHEVILVAPDGAPLAERAAKALQLMLLAAARAEAMFTRRDQQAAVANFRREWSDVLDVMLKNTR